MNNESIIKDTAHIVTTYNIFSIISTPFGLHSHTFTSTLTNFLHVNPESMPKVAVFTENVLPMHL